MTLLDGGLHPRFFAPAIVALVFGYMVFSGSGEKKQYSRVGGSGFGGSDDGVEAWFNPTSQRYETLAPWNEAFMANRHSIKNMPRSEVFQSKPPGR